MARSKGQGNVTAAQRAYTLKLQPEVFSALLTDWSRVLTWVRETGHTLALSVLNPGELQFSTAGEREVFVDWLRGLTPISF